MSESIKSIKDFIREHDYTYSVGGILRIYRNYYKKGYYCSYTAKIVIENNLHHVQVIDNYLKKKGK